jgi:[acyl-carrier-protein] S-malonyltransferase
MPGIAFLFPGQGAQAVGMGRSLAESLPAARSLFAEASEVLGYDLLALCVSGPAERLNATDVSQPAIFVASLAALEHLKATDPAAVEACTAAAGLSLGEYTALAFAGVFPFRDGLRLVQERGRAMQAAAAAAPSGMLSVLGMSREEVEAVVAAARPAGLIEVANLLCPGNIVISGAQAAIGAAEKIAEAKGARTVRLAVAGAFHTPLMEPARAALAAALEATEFRPARVPVWSNVDAKPHTDPAELKALLLQQVARPVLWEETLRGLLADGVERFFEIGPGRVLAGLLKRVHRRADCQNVQA